MSVCSSCRAPIVWAVTAKGKRIPLDRNIVTGGRWQLVDGKAVWSTPDQTVGHHAHFFTCPNASEHRRAR